MTIPLGSVRPAWGSGALSGSFVVSLMPLPGCHQMPFPLPPHLPPYLCFVHTSFPPLFVHCFPIVSPLIHTSFASCFPRLHPCLCPRLLSLLRLSFALCLPPPSPLVCPRLLPCLSLLCPLFATSFVPCFPFLPPFLPPTLPPPLPFATLKCALKHAPSTPSNMCCQHRQRGFKHALNILKLAPSTPPNAHLKAPTRY
jgi:hypothetical protein